MCIHIYNSGHLVWLITLYIGIIKNNKYKNNITNY